MKQWLQNFTQNRRSIGVSKRILSGVLAGSLILLCGCNGAQQTEAEAPEQVESVQESNPSASVVESEENDATESVPEPASPLTEEAFQAQLELLVSELPDGDPVTLETVAQVAPELGDSMEEDPAAVALLCLTDLLAPENNEPLRAAINDSKPETEPTERTQVECALFRCLVKEYEPASSAFIRESSDDYQWLAEYYQFEILSQCEEYGTNPEDAHYQEHPISRQFLIAMLREAVWRMPLLTPLDSELYDQDSYIDAVNCFFFYLESGTPSPQLTVEPTPEQLETLCTETAVWTMGQAETHVVTLEIQLEDGSTTTLTYTP